MVGLNDGVTVCVLDGDTEGVVLGLFVGDIEG